MKRILLGALALAALCAGPSVYAAETSIVCTSAATSADVFGHDVAAVQLVTDGSDAFRYAEEGFMPVAEPLEDRYDLPSSTPTDAPGVLRMRRLASPEVLAGVCIEV